MPLPALGEQFLLAGAVIRQLNPFPIPNVGEKCFARGEPPLEFTWSENSVADLAAQGLLSLAHFGRKPGQVGPAHDEQVDIAGGVGLVLGNRSVKPGGLDAANFGKSAAQCGLDAYRALQHAKDGLQIGVIAIEGVVKLPALAVCVQKALALKAREFAGEIGRVGPQVGCQLADEHARGTVQGEERQHVAPQVGAEGDHCSRIILHLQ
jgi:hypothetical protein